MLVGSHLKLHIFVEYDELLRSPRFEYIYIDGNKLCVTGNLQFEDELVDKTNPLKPKSGQLTIGTLNFQEYECI